MESAIEKRLQHLEQATFGDGDELEEGKSAQQMFEMLVEANNRLANAVKSNEKIHEMLNNPDIQALDKYTDISHFEEAALSQEAKYQILEVSESSIKRNASLLEQVHELSPLLVSKHLSVDDKLMGKLKSLRLLQYEQSDQVMDYNSRASQLVAAYNKMIHVISRQFVVWDRILTEAELRRNSS